MGIARDCLRVPALRVMRDMAVPAAYRKYFLSVDVVCRDRDRWNRQECGYCHRNVCEKEI